MKEGFAKVTKALKKDLKKARKEKKRKQENSNSDSSWSIGTGSTRNLNVEIDTSKKHRLASYIPSGPIKTTLLDNASSLEQMLSSTLEQKTYYLLSEKKWVAAIVVTVRSGPELRPQAKIKKSSKTKTSSKKSSKD